LTLKAKAKDLTLKAKAKDLTLKAKAKAKDLTLKAKAKEMPYCPQGAQGQGHGLEDFNTADEYIYSLVCNFTSNHLHIIFPVDKYI